MDSRLLLLLALVEREAAAQKSMPVAERKKADAYAGPNESFPLYANGEHLAAAWDLAGHAADPAAVKAKILAFAHAHNLMSHLPLSAQHHDITKKALPMDDQDSNGAESPDTDPGPLLQDLLQLCFAHEVAEGDAAQMRVLMDWAAAHQLANCTPQLGQASDALAQKGNSGDGPLLVAKAFPIQKAWGVPQGAIIEGWISTEDVDSEHDIVPPEAFTDALPGYAARRMPLSSEHGMKAYPIGHGQRVALIRNGQVMSQATHPTDPAAFEHLPSSGSGVYGRFLITEPPAADAVVKGNIGGFSWVGKVSRYERRPGGRGRIFRQVDPWTESTIAAYPINSRAILLAANAL